MGNDFPLLWTSVCKDAVILQAIVDLELSIRGVLRNFGLKMGRVAKGRFEERVRELADGNAMLQAAANPVLSARTALRTELAGLEKLARDHARSDPVCRQFMTMPGVGPIVALTVKSAIDDPDRFRSSKDVGPWVGLGSRLINFHSQKMTVAASATAERKTSGHLS